MDRFGKLRWEVSDLVTQVDFLDVTLRITPSGTVDSRLFEKQLNLYLYLPANSCHPPGVLKGIIYGSIFRIRRLTTDLDVCHRNIQDLYRRLLKRGYPPSTLRPIFAEGLARDHSRQPAVLPDTDTPATPHPFFLHVPYHPQDPPSHEIQRLFRETCISPAADAVPMSELCNSEGHPLGNDRLIIAYSRPRNLANLLTPRRIARTPGPSVSTYL
jgi:hypothetical protein